MNKEDTLQEVLERLEAGASLEECLAELSSEEAELLRVAFSLREVEVPSLASEKADAQRAHLMSQASARTNLEGPGQVWERWRERARTAVSGWWRQRSAFDWVIYVGLAPAVLVLVVAALFGMFSGAELPAEMSGAETIAMVESAAESDSIVAPLTGENATEAGTEAAVSDSSLHQAFVPVVTVSGLQSPEIASLYDTQGVVQIQDDDGTWRTVMQSDMLKAGQRVKVGAYSSAKLLFYDGSEAKLGPGSEISIDELNAMPPEEGFRTVVMTQYSGGSQHHVDHRNDAGSVYQVNTPTGSGIARGTIFNVMVAPDTVSQFSVEEGAVAVSDGVSSVLVQAKQISTLSPETAPSEPSFVVTGEGEVTLIDGSMWTIGGQEFEVIEGQTIIIGDPEEGDTVFVLGHVNAEGDLVADQITKLTSGSSNVFTIIGEVGDINEAEDEWEVANQVISVIGADIEDGIEVGDLVRVDGHIEGDMWVAETIVALEDDDLVFPVTLELIGFVDTIDPWKVSDFPFSVDGNTDIDAGIAVDDLVKVTLILEDGEWLATEIRLLGDEEEEVGCFTITAIVLGFSGDGLVIDGWPEIVIGDSVDDNGDEITAGSLVIITVCIGEDGTLTVTSILVISGVFPPPSDDEDGADKVLVCHKPNGNNPHEITIAEPALQAHLGHGDTEGSCDDGNGDGNGDQGAAPAPATGNRVTVCHKGREMTLPGPAAQAHQNHGDTVGSCS